MNAIFNPISFSYDMKSIFCTFVLLLVVESTQAQMERKRSIENLPDPELFLSTSLVTAQTVSIVPKGEIQSAISHSFGSIRSGWGDLFGLDNNAAVHLGLDVGIAQNLSLGIGRTSVDDVFDLRFKWMPYRQNSSDSRPVSVGFYLNTALETLEERRFNYSFTERLSYHSSLMVARQFGRKITLQLSPSLSHFNTLILQDNSSLQHTVFSTLFLGRLQLNERNSLSFETVPILSDPKAIHHWAFSYEIETGGHVFQLFLQSGYLFTEQYIVKQTSDSFWEGDIRLGFAIHRVFQLKKKK